MGGWQCKETHILDNTTWLRNVINQHPKLKKSVNTFEGFTIEPFVSRSQRTPQSNSGSSTFSRHCEDASSNHSNQNVDVEQKPTSSALGKIDVKRKRCSKVFAFNCLKSQIIDDGLTNIVENKKENSSKSLLEVLDKEGIKHFKVTICYKNRKEKVHRIHWIVKTASCMNENSCASQLLRVSVDSLMQEMNVYKVLIAEISRYLKQYSHRPQAKFLLNLPDFIFSEYCNLPYKSECNLVLEDISHTKHCRPVDDVRIATGLTLAEFKVFLATLAQIHAVGVSWQTNNNEKFVDIKGMSIF